MLLKNNTCQKLEVLLDNKKYVWNAGESIELEEREARFAMMIQPMLVTIEEVVINAEPQEVKVAKNVKNKKSRK